MVQVSFLVSFILAIVGAGVLIWYVDTGFHDIDKLSHRKECPISWFAYWLLASYGAFFLHSLAYFARHLKEWMFVSERRDANDMLQRNEAPGMWYVLRDWILVAMEFTIIVLGVVLVLQNKVCLKEHGEWSTYPFNITLSYYQQTVVWIAFHSVLFFVSLCIGCVHSAFFAVLYYNEKLEELENKRYHSHAELERQQNARNRTKSLANPRANSIVEIIESDGEDDPMNNLLEALIVEDQRQQQTNQY